MKKLILISFILIFANKLSAQEIKVLEATQQSWAGGECCSNGINYIINLESADTVKTIKVDTVWMDGQYYVEKPEHNFTFSKTILNGKEKYQIYFGKSWGKSFYQDTDFTDAKPTIKPPYYKGQALVIYYYKRRRHTIEIEKFTELASIAYP